MSGSVAFHELFDAEFLAALASLSLSVRHVAGGGRTGGRTSRDRGGGLEFKDYRSYSPGDDLRAIDWNVYRRFGKLTLRLFDEQQDLPLYLLPDVSGSLFLESPLRIVACLRATLALAAIGLEHHDSAGLMPFSDDLYVVFKSLAGRSAVMTFARRLALLAEATHSQATNLPLALDRLAQMRLRPGLVVIVSDFFDPHGFTALEQSLRSLRHRLLFIQLARASDARPDIHGDVRLHDCETGTSVELTVTAEVATRYTAAYREFNQDLRALARRYEGHVLTLDVEQDLLPQLATLFESGSVRA